jgi:hypothetical protein
MLHTQKRSPIVIEEEELLGEVHFDDTDELRKLIGLLNNASSLEEKVAFARAILEKFPDSPIAEFALENVAENDPSPEVKQTLIALLQRRS